MIPSILTVGLFSLSALFATRSIRAFGMHAANLGRIGLATLLLAVWAYSFGAGIEGAGFLWLVLSGVIGLGLGDIAYYQSLVRLGPRLTVLIMQCGAAPIAAATEWAWLGTRLSVAQIVCASVILAGVALALAPDRVATGGAPAYDPAAFQVGALWGVGAAVGQGIGAVLSRHAQQISEAAGLRIDGGTAAYQRALGGVAIILAWAVAAALAAKRTRKAEEMAEAIPFATRLRRSWPLMLGNALAGPVLGVGCFQWGLASEPTGIVLPLVSTVPLATMALAWAMREGRPPARAVAGGVVAVAGAALLAASR